MQYDPEVYETWSYDQVMIEIEAVVQDCIADFGPDASECDIWHDTVVGYLPIVRWEVARELMRCQLGWTPHEIFVWSDRNRVPA